MKIFISSLILFILCSANATAQSWNISLDIADVTCKDANDGQINLKINGEDNVSDSLYSWQWLDPSGMVFDTLSDPVQFLSPGTYSVRVTRLSDQSVISASGTIEQSDSALSVTMTVLQENHCNGDAAGIVKARASGGSDDYMYGLSTGINPEGPNYTKGYADNGGLFPSLPSGTYIVWAIDSRGCEATTSSFTITEPEAITVVYDVMNASCDDTGGHIVINSISGGNPFDTNQAGGFNFQLEWKDASNDSLIAVNEASIGALPSGIYQLTIRDKNACIETLRIIVERGFKFEITEARNVSCNFQKNGIIRCSLDASNPSFQEPFSIGVHDANGNEIASLARSNLNSGNVTFRDLGPGSYTIEVTDALGCVKEQAVELTQPDKIQVESVVVTDIKCKGTPTGEISFDVSGGSGGYEFSIDSGTTYAANPLFTQLYQGTYDLFVKDDGGCELNAGDVIVREPPTGYWIEEVEVTDVLCNGNDNGAIEIFFTDATSPSHLDEDTDIEWMNDKGELIQRGSPRIGDLSEGRYEVEIRDKYGCVFNKLIEVNRKYELRADFSINTSRYAVDYPIRLENKSLGNGVVSWLWDYGNGQGSTEENTTATYSEPGTYAIELTIENEVGCRDSTRDTIEIEKGFSFVVPTAFSPNGDRLNDVFRPTFDNVIRMRMLVVNLDGITVYESDDLSASWDGTHNGLELPQGPYYFEIRYTTGSGATRKEKGKVFLLK